MKYDHPFTYWDYRGGNFHKNMGMRIDLVYANAAFADAVTDAYVDREARKGSSRRARVRATTPRSSSTSRSDPARCSDRRPERASGAAQRHP